MAITMEEIGTLLETDEWQRRIKAAVVDFRRIRFYDDQDYEALVQVAFLAVIDKLMKRGTVDGLRGVYHNAIFHELRKDNRKMAIVKIPPREFKKEIQKYSQVPLDAFTENAGCIDDLSLTTKVAYDDVMDSLTDDQRKIARMRLAGYNNCAITRKLGFTNRHYVDREWKKIQRRFAEHFCVPIDE